MRVSSSLAAATLLFATVASIASAIAQPPASPDSVQTAPPAGNHLGVIPLPQGPAITAPQSALPEPTHTLPKSDRPLGASPDLRSVATYTRDHPITLRDAVAIALYTSRDLAAATAQLQQAEGRTGEARSMLRPTLGGEADITEFDAPTTANLGAFLPQSPGSNAAAPPPFVITNQFNPELVATLNLPLDVAGTLRSAASQAQFQEVAARIDVNRARNQIVYNVKAAFFNVLRAQAQVAVATDALNNSLVRLDAANKNFTAGTAPRFDVISAQRDVADAQQNLVNARAQRAASIAALKSTIGMSLDTRIAISDQGALSNPPGVEPVQIGVPPGVASSLNGADAGAPSRPIDTPKPAPAQPINTNENADSPTPGALKPALLPLPTTSEVDDDFDFGPDYKNLLIEAFKTRGEVLEGDAEIAAAKRGVQYARRSSLPSVNLSLSDTYSPNNAGFTRQNVGAVTLGVTLPIFDGGLTRSRVREAYGAIAVAEVNRRQAIDQVTSDLQQAYITLVQSRSRIAVSNVEIARAREAYRLALVRYNAGVSQQAGVSPQVELSDAQNTLTLAESNQINALYDYNNARAQLDRAVGRFSFTGSSPGYPSPPPLPAAPGASEVTHGAGR